MSWKKVKSVVGKVGKIAAPIAAGVLGGPAAGAMVAAGIRSQQKGANLGNVLGAGLGGAAAGGMGAGAKAGMAGKAGIMGKIAGGAKGAVGMGAAKSAAGSPLVAPYGSGTFAGFATPTVAKGADAASRLGKVGGWLKDGKNLQTAVTGVSTVAGLADAAQDRKVQNKMLGMQQERFGLDKRNDDLLYEQQRNRMANMEWLMPYLQNMLTQSRSTYGGG